MQYTHTKQAATSLIERGDTPADVRLVAAAILDHLTSGSARDADVLITILARRGTPPPQRRN